MKLCREGPIFRLLTNVFGFEFSIGHSSLIYSVGMSGSRRWGGLHCNSASCWLVLRSLYKWPPRLELPELPELSQGLSARTVVRSHFGQQLTIAIRAGFKPSFPFGTTGKLPLKGEWQGSSSGLESEMQKQQMRKAPPGVPETSRWVAPCWGGWRTGEQGVFRLHREQECECLTCTYTDVLGGQLRGS